MTKTTLKKRCYALSRYSDEQLIAELKRRGYDVHKWAREKESDDFQEKIWHQGGP